MGRPPCGAPGPAREERQGARPRPAPPSRIHPSAGSERQAAAPVRRRLDGDDPRERPGEEHVHRAHAREERERAPGRPGEHLPLAPGGRGCRRSRRPSTGASPSGRRRRPRRSPPREEGAHRDLRGGRLLERDEQRVRRADGPRTSTTPTAPRAARRGRERRTGRREDAAERAAIPEAFMRKAKARTSATVRTGRRERGEGARRSTRRTSATVAPSAGTETASAASTAVPLAARRSSRRSARERPAPSNDAPWRPGTGTTSVRRVEQRAHRAEATRRRPPRRGGRTA